MAARVTTVQAGHGTHRTHHACLCHGRLAPAVKGAQSFFAFDSPWNKWGARWNDMADVSVGE